MELAASEGSHGPDLALCDFEFITLRAYLPRGKCS